MENFTEKEFKKSNLGNYSLIIAFLGFVTLKTINFEPIKFSTLDFITLVFEAALVGALADWYAVTALFRHPLGIKIPHTNILAKKKDEIAHGISSVMKDFLPHQVIKEHLSQMDFASLINNALLNKKVTEEFKENIKKFISEILNKMKEPNYKEKKLEVLLNFAKSFDYSRTTVKLGSSLINSESYYKASVSTSELLKNIILKNRTSLASNIEDQIKGELPFLMKMFANGKGDLVVEKILVFLETLKNPESNGYRSIKKEIVEFLYKLESHDETKENFNKKVTEFLENRDTLENLLSFIDSLSDKIAEKVHETNGSFDKILDYGFDMLKKRYLENPDKKEKINLWISDFIFNLIEKHDLIDKSSLLIKDEITKLSEDDFVKFIEINVYNDLQYIRLNGAVVGGLGGALIYLVQVAISLGK